MSTGTATSSAVARASCPCVPRASRPWSLPCRSAHGRDAHATHGRDGRATPGRARRGAFTFVEVLATLMLLSIVLPSVMSGISLCLSTADFAKREAQASALCHGKLMEMVAGGDWQHAAVAGDFGADWPDFNWTAQVSDFSSTTLKSVDVTVSWRHRNKDRSVTLTTLVYAGAAQ